MGPFDVWPPDRPVHRHGCCREDGCVADGGLPREAWSAGRATFERVLARVPDLPPEPGDERKAPRQPDTTVQPTSRARKSAKSYPRGSRLTAGRWRTESTSDEITRTAGDIWKRLQHNLVEGQQWAVRACG
jgi:hypothetical protein